MRVLIAEDSLMARRVLYEAVEFLGHECLQAEDGEAAWTLYEAHGADVIISDWVMPQVDGLELCRRVRAQPHASLAAPYTYFIFLTVFEDKRHVVAAMEAGADDYLTKPLDPADLQARLIAAERVTALHRELAARDALSTRRLVRREALLRLARRLAAQSEPEQLFTDLLTEAVTALVVSDGVLARWDEARQMLVPLRGTVAGPDHAAPLAIGQGAAGRAVAQRSTVVVNDYQRDCGTETPAGRAGVQSAVAAPMLHEGRLLGALTVVSYDSERRFSAEEAGVLELMAQLGAAAIVGVERARLDGVLLGVRTMEHELNNKLTLTAGYTEMLSEDARLPERLQRAAREAHRGARAAAEIVTRLHSLAELHETQWGPKVGSTIDLQQSAG
jgi:DNA-binding response OmpR family regulator